MCGIIGAVSQRDITTILIKGLRRLEYRGYDSAGLAIIDHNCNLKRLRTIGNVNNLVNEFKMDIIIGNTGIAHTRWATHGQPIIQNAHPHISNHIAIVHNGIIENYSELKQLPQIQNYIFTSETDTEVIAHLIHYELQQGGTLLEVVQRIIPLIIGTYSIVIMDSRIPGLLIAARSSSPLIIGLGINENFIASDQLALLPITRRFIYLEEGDTAEVTKKKVRIFNYKNIKVHRKCIESNIKNYEYNKGIYRDFMQKEIYEQPLTIKNTLKGRIDQNQVVFCELDEKSDKILSKIEHIQIIACGTSYNAGMVGRYWFESLVNIPCDVDIASEYCYRKPAHRTNSLFITLSQSGETADTLAALRLSKKLNYLLSLTICNVLESSLVRESNLALMTKAGIEISVASTKSFTSQLTVLLLLVAYINRLKKNNIILEKQIIVALHNLPIRIENILSQDNIIKIIAEDFLDKNHTLFLGRGDHFPIALEGALKLKEISYIHAEAYAAGELKHGALALINSDMPVIIVAPNNQLLKKLKSNIEEVRSRAGHIYIFTDKNTEFIESNNIKIIPLVYVEDITSPIIYIIPFQLLSYYVALMKGNNIDQPRNLAKSVTVE